MLRPSQEVFQEHARRGNLVPVVRELLADMDTPLSIFRRLDDGRTSFLFESVEGGEKWGRYSFIGTGARAIFRARGREVEWDVEVEHGCGQLELVNLFAFDGHGLAQDLRNRFGFAFDTMETR